LSPFQWAQKDEALNAFDFHEFFEDTGTQVVPLERPGEVLDEILVIVNDERDPAETGQIAVMREKASIAVIEEGVSTQKIDQCSAWRSDVSPGDGAFSVSHPRLSADPDPQRNAAG
jgi:hypothetical protein